MRLLISTSCAATGLVKCLKEVNSAKIYSAAYCLLPTVYKTTGDIANSINSVVSSKTFFQSKLIVTSY